MLPFPVPADILQPLGEPAALALATERVDPPDPPDPSESSNPHDPYISNINPQVNSEQSVGQKNQDLQQEAKKTGKSLEEKANRKARQGGQNKRKMADPVDQKEGDSQREEGNENIGKEIEVSSITDYELLLEGISSRIEEKRAEVDWEEEVHALMEEEAKGKEASKKDEAIEEAE